LIGETVLIDRSDINNRLDEALQSYFNGPIPDHVAQSSDFAAFWKDCRWGVKVPHVERPEGWVYVLRQAEDPWFKNKCSKIGLASRDPQVRANEMFQETAVVRRLNVEFAAFAPDMKKLECDVHNALLDRLADGKEEVFEVELVEAIETILEISRSTQNSAGLYLVSPTAASAARSVMTRTARPTGCFTSRYDPSGGDEYIASKIGNIVDVLMHHETIRTKSEQAAHNNYKHMMRTTIFAAAIIAFASLAFGFSKLIYQPAEQITIIFLIAIGLTPFLVILISYILKFSAGNSFRSRLRSTSQRLQSIIEDGAKSERPARLEIHLSGIQHAGTRRDLGWVNGAVNQQADNSVAQPNAPA
jgi:hypothetical protein